MESHGFSPAYAPGLALRMHTSEVERLVRIDVPHARNFLLIEQPGTSRRARALQCREEVSCPVTRIERLRTEARRAGPPLVARERLDGAEATRVVENQERSALESEPHRGMAGSTLTSGGGREGEQTAGHAEIHGYDAVAFESDQDVLATSADAVDAASPHASNELCLRLPENVVVHHFHATDVFSENRCSQAANDRLGLGKLRHVGVPSNRCQYD